MQRQIWRTVIIKARGCGDVASRFLDISMDFGANDLRSFTVSAHRQCGFVYGTAGQ
jgi:hypothetical protein